MPWMTANLRAKASGKQARTTLPRFVVPHVTPDFAPKWISSSSVFLAAKNPLVHKGALYLECTSHAKWRRIPCDEDFGALVAEGLQSVASDDASSLSSKEGSQPLHSV